MANWITNIWNSFSSSRFFNKKGYYYVEQIGNKEPISIDIENLESVYNEISDLKKVIDKRAEMTSKLEWAIEDDEGNIIEDNKLSAKDKNVLNLLYNPNPLSSGKDFISQLSIVEDIYGNAYINQVVGLRGVLPSALHILPGKFLKVKLTGKIYKQVDIKGIIERYELMVDGSITETFEVEEVIRFKQPDPNPVIAESKIKALQPQLSNIKGAYDSRNILINERGPNGIISQKPVSNQQLATPMSKDDRAEAERQLTENFGNKRGQRRMLISQAPLDYQATGFPTKDLLLFEEVEADVNVIIDLYGLSNNLFSNDNTYENHKESEKAGYQDTIIPRADRWAEIFTQEFYEEREKRRIVAVFDVEVLHENIKEKNDARKVEVETTALLLDNNLIDNKDAQEILELDVKTIKNEEDETNTAGNQGNQEEEDEGAEG